MKFEELPEEIKECIALHQMFRHLGFDGKDLYLLCPTNGGDKKFGIAFMHNGESQNVAIGKTNLTYEDFQRFWLEAGKLVNDELTPDELDVYVKESKVFQKKLHFISILVSNDMIPKVH